MRIIMPEGKIIRDRLDVDKVVEDVIRGTHDLCGALAIFIGYVKGVVGGRKVFALEYEALEPHASKKLQEIAERYCKESVHDVRIYHRVGSLRPGEPALYIFVSAVDRASSIETLRCALEDVKREVPVFKLERREDGDYWIVGDKRIRRLVGERG